MPELATFDFPLTDEDLYEQVGSAMSLVEGAGYSPRKLVLSQQAALRIPLGYPLPYPQGKLFKMEVTWFGLGSPEGFAIGAEPYRVKLRLDEWKSPSTLKHEYAPAGMLWVCRWCGELEEEMEEAEAGCSVPLTTRFLEKKWGELNLLARQGTIEFRRYSTFG